MPTETVCPDCGGSGWKIIERADLSGAQRCDCVFGERARRLEENAAIPPLYRNASFRQFRAAARGKGTYFNSPIEGHEFNYYDETVADSVAKAIMQAAQFCRPTIK